MKPSQEQERRVFPAYPFLFAIYPPLALLAANVSEVEITVALRPILLSIIFAAFLVLVLGLILKDWQKAALVATFMLLLFFSYGHIYHLIKNTILLGINIGRHRVLFIIFLILAILGIGLIIKKFKTSSRIPMIANFITLAMVLFSLLRIGIYHLQTANSSPMGSAETAGYTSSLTVPEPAPDIYYIILDMYTRSDALESDFNYDNSWFIDELENMGFFVADCSRSNYSQTELSLSSSLNMDYLPKLDPNLSENVTSMDALTRLLKQNKVRLLLENAGYQTVAFETGYYWDSWSTADIYLQPSSKAGFLRQVTPFESLFIQTTAGLILTDSQALVSNLWINAVNNPFGEYVDRQRFILDQMESIATVKGPKFVFAHIMIPHFPFIFKADGSLQTDPGFFSNRNTPVDESYFQEGYIAQVEFISQRTLEFLKKILSQSKNPVIIIVQGDHGVREENRSAILNAYYFPDPGQELYASLSPVNSFRLIFDRYFGTQMGLLEDHSYSSNTTRPFAFSETIEKSPYCKP